MHKIQIMILGNNENDIAPIINQLNQTSEWQVSSFTDKEQAINHFQQGVQDVVIFHEDIEASTKSGLSRLFQFQEEDIILITSGKENAVWEEVNEALEALLNRNKKPGLTFVDDALKHAQFNICLN